MAARQRTRRITRVSRGRFIAQHDIPTADRHLINQELSRHPCRCNRKVN